MKRVTKLTKVIFLSLIMMLPFTMLLAQVDTTGIDTVPLPTDVFDLFANFGAYMGSLAGLAAASLFLSKIVNSWSKITKAWIKQVVSWVIPVVIALVGTFIVKVGILVGQPFWIVLVSGAAAGLVSNGIFDIVIVKQLLNWLAVKFGKKQ